MTLRNSGEGKRGAEVPRLIDCGADVTLIPHHAVPLLGVSIAPNTGYEVMGVGGRKSMARVVSLDLIVLRRAFNGRLLVSNQA